MAEHHSNQQADPFVARLLRIPSGLRAGGRDHGNHAVLAIYHHHEGSYPFAICRNGLLIDPEGQAKFVPFHGIDNASSHDIELLRHEKSMMRRDGRVGTTSLPLSLTTGETVLLPLNEREDGMSERLLIAGLIEQRIRIALSERRHAQD